MAEQVLKDCKIYWDGFNLSADHNILQLTHGAEIQDKTVFGNATRTKKAGLKTVEMANSGFWDSDGTDEPDDVLFPDIGTEDQIITMCPIAGAEAERAYFFKSDISAYEPGGAIGDMFVFNVAAIGSGELVRGTMMKTGVVTANGNGTAIQEGAVSATQYLYAAIHAIAVSGTNPTLDVKIQCDNAENFASPTDKITFTQLTAIGAEFATRVSGAITDDWWRATWTIGGTDTPTFNIIVVIGIQ